MYERLCMSVARFGGRGRFFFHHRGVRSAIPLLLSPLLLSKVFRASI